MVLQSARVLVLWLLVAVSIGNGACVGQSSRVLWRVRLPGQFMEAPPRLGPDGTVYAVARDGSLHAISPSGSVLWTRTGAGAEGLAVGGDGTIYTGTNDRVEAWTPSGQKRWVYPISPRAFIFQGLAVGPDGMVYVLTASSSFGGPGLFSLSPTGQLLWSTPEPYSRPVVNHQELRFGRTPDRRAWQFVYSANGHLARVHTGSGQRTVVPQGARAQPFVGAEDRIYCGTVAHDAAGTFLWRSGSSLAAAASGGDVYATRGNLQRLRGGSGSVVWTYSDGRYPGQVAEAPDGRLVVFASSANSATKNNSVMAVDERGRLLWTVPLPIENGNRLTQFAPAEFTADGDRAYLSVATIGATRPFYSYVYAIDLRGASSARSWDYGVACSASPTRPRIAVVGVPRLGATVSVELTGAAAGGVGLIVIGAESRVVRLDDIGLVGCWLYPRLDAVATHGITSSGSARQGLAIPNSPALTGARVLCQWAFVSGAVSSGLTPGLGLRLGR